MCDVYISVILKSPPSCTDTQKGRRVQHEPRASGGTARSLTPLTEDSFRPEYFGSLKGKNGVAFVDCFQVVCVTKGTVEAIIVHFC